MAPAGVGGFGIGVGRCRAAANDALPQHGAGAAKGHPRSVKGDLSALMASGCGLPGGMSNRHWHGTCFLMRLSWSRQRGALQTGGRAGATPTADGFGRRNSKKVTLWACASVANGDALRRLSAVAKHRPFGSGTTAERPALWRPDAPQGLMVCDRCTQSRSPLRGDRAESVCARAETLRPVAGGVGMH